MAPAKAPAKAPEPVSAAKEAKVAPAVNDDMKASFSSDLEKAKQFQRIAKGALTVAASKMFSFYSNLLSPEKKVHVEQDHQQADRKRPLRQPSR